MPRFLRRLRTPAPLALFSATAVVQLMTGCATGGPPPPPPETTVEIVVPLTTPLPETTELQQKGGISITVAPAPFSVEPDERCEYSPSGAFVLFPPRGVSEDTHTHLEELRFPTNRLVGGDEVTFIVTITNQMERVFRGSGALVQFNIDGRVQGIEQESYRQLLTSLIPPGEERQFEIGGLPFASLPTEGTVGLSLFDVTTAIDAAGNITERQNFEWFFRIVLETRTESVTGTRTRMWLPNALTRVLMDDVGRCYDSR